ncbi:aspartate/glutamate racemase family protein [Massilia sp. TS11]|uniref:aspartate/glutamate racemase family protein n=1 Tax=Massilia sp. TS11 TaxID=2908003 RepID=UPI001EDA04CB|nr:amino acid racemase [Massilia sp. TS11]MCG2586644.1 amino acid racemase [Massilia sp. TS11]
MKQPGLVGVLGGMGPLATVDFLHKLVALTPAARDQDHVPTVVWNVPQVPDRQHYLAGHGADPLPALLAGVAALNQAGACRIVIPCNTAHYWYAALAAASAAPILHIADITVDALALAPGARVGLIATEATLAAGIYQQRLAARGLDCLVPAPEITRTAFTPGCYAVKRHALAEGGALLAQVADHLQARGAERLILACTEVPPALSAIASPHLAHSIDPADALARALIATWQKEKSGSDPDFPAR